MSTTPTPKDDPTLKMSDARYMEHMQETVVSLTRQLAEATRERDEARTQQRLIRELNNKLGAELTAANTVIAKKDEALRDAIRCEQALTKEYRDSGQNRYATGSEAAWKRWEQALAITPAAIDAAQRPTTKGGA